MLTRYDLLLLCVAILILARLWVADTKRSVEHDEAFTIVSATGKLAAMMGTLADKTPPYMTWTVAAAATPPERAVSRIGGPCRKTSGSSIHNPINKE